MKKITICLGCYLFTTAIISLFAHCEIPCGIYGDETRVALIHEHCRTVEKSMKKIVKISAAEKVDNNQLVRWVNNKEEHCNKIQKIVAQYFMTQRIKLVDEKDPAYKSNQKKLELLHQMLVYAMKCKQTVDTSFVEKIKKSLADFEKVYFDKK